jgi:hypothetical protein
MKKLDEQIAQVEQRIARRRMAVELTARATWHRAVGRLVSPAGLIGAATLGFVTVAAALRRRPKIVERRTHARAAGKWGSVLGLLGSAAFALAKSQYGGPAQMAAKLAEQVKAFQQKRRAQRHAAVVP